MRMTDVRILTLYKQHYLDRYDDEMSKYCTYSCLGYYDGLDISKIDVDNRDISFEDIQKKNAEMVQHLNGRYSSQYISIIRAFVTKENDYGENQQQDVNLLEYWKYEAKLPYIAIGFIKLVNKNVVEDNDIYDLIQYIDSLSRKNDHEECRVLTYTTIDNADLIVLIKGNSISQISEILIEIEKSKKISYIHSIIGISEKYLDNCYEFYKDNLKITCIWNGIDCHINERLDRITLQLVTNGDESVLYTVISRLKDYNIISSSSDNSSNVTWSHSIGHEDILITIKNTNVETLIKLLLKGHLATHTNGIYGNGLYNIESIIEIKENIDSIEEPPDYNMMKYIYDNNIEIKGNCRERIKKIKLWKNKLPGLNTLVQAAIQMISTLDQFEQFEMSKDIYYLIEPSLNAVLDHVDEWLNNKQEQISLNDVEKIKKLLCSYIESVNSVIYHTIHTDQVYLMIPGYCGVSFSIPLKLSVFNMWFLGEIADILTTTEKTCAFIMTPDVESRPTTESFSLEPSKAYITINIKFSQRLLYNPRELMIILAHETAHYIGDKQRKRNLRLECICKTVTYFIVEVIMNGVEDIFNENDPYYSTIKGRLLSKIVGLLNRYIKKEAKDDNYYARDIFDLLKNVCTKILVSKEETRGIYQTIMSFPNIIVEDVSGNIDYLRKIIESQMIMDENRIELLYSNVLYDFISILISAYKETFSDIVACTILDCSKYEFDSAYLVSEGDDAMPKTKPYIYYLREQTLISLFGWKRHNNSSIYRGSDNTNLRTPKLADSKNEILLANITNYIWVYKHLYEYAEECKKDLEKTIKSKYESVNEVRKIYKSLNESFFIETYEKIYDKSILYKRHFGDKKIE